MQYILKTHGRYFFFIHVKSSKERIILQQLDKKVSPLFSKEWKVLISHISKSWKEDILFRDNVSKEWVKETSLSEFGLENMIYHEMKNRRVQSSYTREKQKHTLIKMIKILWGMSNSLKIYFTGLIIPKPSC